MNKNDKIECPEYDALCATMDAAKAEVKKAGAKAVHALFKVFFAQYPDVKAVGWTQYTPYFNDGDACVFRVNDDFYVSTETGTNFAEVSSLDDEDVFTNAYSRALPGPMKEALNRLERSVDKDLFEAAFGDHVMVIATPEGFHVNEYEHD